MTKVESILDDWGTRLRSAASDLLEGSDFLSRTIGMSNSYEALEYIVQALGHKPVSLLGKDFSFIFDHVRRNYRQGTVETGYYDSDCPKFTFYKSSDKPTIRFVDPYDESRNNIDRWVADMEFTNTATVNGYYTYAESLDGKGNQGRSVEVVDPDGTARWKYTSIPDDKRCDLLAKTNHNFQMSRYETLIARFYTNTEHSRDLTNPTQTAVSKEFGMSHGRNLLKLTPDEPNGYKNPYCRVWTYHHEYTKINDLIRPFGEGQPKDGFDGTASFRTFPHDFYGFDRNGRSILWNQGVLNYANGHVRIAPTAKISDYFNGSGYDDGIRDKYSPKNCMFSIENLAWKNTDTDKSSFDAYGLSAEQKGPLGGRIMWFPPYNLKFQETVDVRWNPNQFIGRGEPIYTYTNTERGGSLSFTLLIDHPSILDYLKKDAIGDIARKDGTIVGVNDNTSSGPTDGVDDKFSAEQTILRFFAGCDVLTAEPQKYKYRVNNKPSNGDEVPADPESTQPDPDTKAENSKPNGKIVCFLYFPNNYSGRDDKPEFAVDYLMNGIGAQLQYIDSTSSVTDIAVDTSICPKVSGTSYGGYEVTNGLGISVAESAETTDSGYIKPGVSKLNTTTATSSTVVASYGQNSYVLAKDVSKSGDTSQKWYCKWFYRVDDDHVEGKNVSDVMKHAESYVDTCSFQLNSKGYNEVYKVVGGVEKNFGIKQDEHTMLVGFTDLYAALNGMGGAIDSSKCTSGNVEVLKDIFNNSEKYKITNITIRGNASKQGNITDNKALATNRAKTFGQWLNSKVKGSNLKIDDSVEPNLQDPLKDHPDVGKNSSLNSKIWRSAMMTIEYACEDVKKSQETDVDQSGNVDTVGEKAEAKGTPSKPNQLYQFTVDGWNDMSLEQKILYTQTHSYERMMYGDELMDEYEEFRNIENPDSSTGISTVKRYDNEGEFFKEVDRTNNFLRHKIKDKIKYFDPAFHSISPEGFSARLTFLHQCTRQGSTISNSAWDSSTAYNLAFGRPPVCVLRLGDFYYTKIVITSLQISYDDVQWDLNPEGAGVIPMFADVSIQFKFLGGSDLGGPIARLQNAVSFNYYANSSVYDNRAEMVKYDESGNGKEIAFKPFTYPNSTGRKIGTGGEYGEMDAGRHRYTVDREHYKTTGEIIATGYERIGEGLSGHNDGMWSDL